MNFVRSLSCLSLLLFISVVEMLAADINGPGLAESAERINLALRRVADGLLRAAGDSTSRIPPVKQISANHWRVQLQQDFSYDSLPYLLQSSLDQYGIREAYEVAIRRCDDATIDLGFHQQDFLQDSTVPCSGREPPPGCHYMEVTFLSEGKSKTAWAGIGSVLLVLLLLAAGVWWWFRKNKISTGPATVPEGEDWLTFGQSRLSSNHHIVECGGVRHQLTYREAKLLHLFVTHPGEVLERDQILRQVWSDEGVQVSRSVDVFVSRLRKKLKMDPTLGIAAVHGLGYRLEIGSNVQ